MHSMSPAPCDEAFLTWFRKRTEAAWRRWQPINFEEYMYWNGEVVSDWQRGTRWSQGLTEEEIAAAEKRWNLSFPPDYRLFLKMLHRPDRPMIRASYWEGELSITEWMPPFYNWKTGDAAIQQAYDWLVEGLFFDVMYNSLWPASWGPKPETEAAQKPRVQELVGAAPKLIPVYAHAYLLAEPCQAGNPVLSIWQSDMIVAGDNLHDYLLLRWSELIDKRYDPFIVPKSRSTFYDRYHVTRHQEKDYSSIPFWGEFLSLVQNGLIFYNRPFLTSEETGSEA